VTKCGRGGGEVTKNVFACGRKLNRRIDAVDGKATKSGVEKISLPTVTKFGLSLVLHSLRNKKCGKVKA
jgi:hypothetical protein